MFSVSYFAFTSILYVYIVKTLCYTNLVMLNIVTVTPYTHIHVQLKCYNCDLPFNVSSCIKKTLTNIVLKAAFYLFFAA